MKRHGVHRLPVSSWLAAGFLAFLCQPCVVSHASPPAASVEFCRVMDHEEWLVEHPVPAASKVTAAVTAGEPGTVRMIYFLPNDRPYRQSVVDTMKARMVRLQRFFGEQMESHGYGYMTFRYEADADGEPVVHRVDGAHGNAYYLKKTSGPVARESWPYAGHAHVYFAVVDNSTGLIHSRYGAVSGVGSGSKNGGKAIVGAGSGFALAAHELAHAFGLMWHDFRDDTYILSYGMDRRRRLSACSARHLSVSPFFNPEISYDKDRSLKPTIEYIGPTRWYAPGTQRFTLPWRVSDPDGIHLVIQWVGNPEDNQLAPQVKACRAMDGETEAVVAFEYDGVIPQLRHSSFAYPAVHAVPARAVDTQGYSRSGGPVVIAQASPHHLATLEGQASRPYIDVAFSPAGGIMAGGSVDGTLSVWDVATRREIATPEGAYAIASVAFSPDGRILAAGEYFQPIRLYDTETWEEIAVLKRHKRYVNDVAFSPDGGLLASASWDTTVKLWDTETWEEIATLHGHTDFVKSAAFSPGGGILASGSTDSTVRVWDVAARQEIAMLDRHTDTVFSVAFSPDGAILASGSRDGTIRLWDTAAWKEIAVLKARTRRRVTSIAFSPDGGKLAARSQLGLVDLWDVLCEEIVAQLTAPGDIISIAFSPDGSLLAGSMGYGIELWDTSSFTSRRSRAPDWDGDGEVGFGDFVKFAAKYGGTRGQAGFDPRFDLDGDGTIGFADFLVFARAFGKAA